MVDNVMKNQKTGDPTVLQRQPFQMDAGRIQAHLRILETTDLHLNLLPYDYYLDRPAPQMGLAQTASLIRRLRADSHNCLLFDNGDFLQGNPVSDLIAKEGFAGGTHPMIAAMNALGYDAATLGNHEFNYGLGFLQQAIAQARFPIVSANITVGPARDAAQDQTLVAPWCLIDKQITAADGRDYPLRIGVIGFAPPQLTSWDRHLLGAQIDTHDIIVAARAQVPLLRAAGAEVVIALCHSGIGADQHAEGMENAAVPLAAVPGIDALLAGHTHQVFPGPGIRRSAAVDPGAGTLHGVPAVMAGFNGSHLGVIDLLLDRHDGVWTPVAHASQVMPIAQRDADNRMQALVATDTDIEQGAQGLHDRVRAEIRRPVGHTAIPLQSYFALVAPDPTLQIVADAQRAYAARYMQGTVWSDLPVISAVAPFKVGGRSGPENFLDIAPGALKLRHAAELYLYPNALCILELTGAGVIDWLEHSAGLFLTVTPGVTDQPLIDPEFPSYNFDVFDGLTYVIDPSQPPRCGPDGQIRNPQARRISNLQWHGSPLTPDMRVVVISNSYRAGGGGGFAAAKCARMIHQATEGTRDVVIRHLRDGGPLRPATTQVWRFASLLGTAAWFDTGPGARAHMGGLDANDISDIGPSPEGFHRFSLRF